jgi:hypothetical protein
MGSWGTLCGSLAGSLGVLNLMNLHGTLGHEVMEWYTNQNFPLANFEVVGNALDSATNYGAGALGFSPIQDSLVKGHSVADSPLCHISVSKWVAAAGVKLGDKNLPDFPTQCLKEDRCGKVTADTAAYTAALLNAYLANPLDKPAAWVRQASMASCFDCHDSKSTVTTTRKDVQTQMSCTPCHTEPVSGRK